MDKYTLDSISSSLGNLFFFGFILLLSSSSSSSSGLTRRDLVAMAVLLGCDYMPQGVPGVGREKALQLVREGVDLLDLLQEKRTSDGTVGERRV